jgi:hypothetical protein
MHLRDLVTISCVKNKVFNRETNLNAVTPIFYGLFLVKVSEDRSSTFSHACAQKKATPVLVVINKTKANRGTFEGAEQILAKFAQ